MEADQIDVDGSVGSATGTTYTPPAPTPQEEIDPGRALSMKMKVKGTNQESHEKDKPPTPSVSSCNVFKSQLQEYCQKIRLTMPVYESIKEGPSHVPVFKSTVVVNNARYVSLPGCYNRKAAEQSAAEVAILALAKSNNSSSEISQPVMEASQIDVGCSVRIATGTTYTPPAPTTQEEIDRGRTLSRKMKVKGTNQESHKKNKPPSVSSCYGFKSQLLEYCQKTGLTMPAYETIKEGPSHEPVFKSTVVVNNARYVSLPGFYNRKAAEQSAAEVALLALAKSNNSSNGISQPVMEAGQIDVGGIVGIATGTTYTPPAPTTQSEIDLSRDLSRKMKVMGTNLESHEKNKPPSVSSCYVFKSQLLEYCQKTGLTTPTYETIKEGPSHEPVFKSTVVVNNVRYVSLPGFYNRKAAEQSAAEVALLALAKSNNSSSEISQPVLKTGLCKNLLQDYAQKMNNVSPLYTCRWEEKEGKTPIFSCVVAIGSIMYTGASAGTKKEAEIKAARTALLAIQTAVPVTEDHTSNPIYTVVPQKRKGSDLAISIQETKESLKPKKGWVKKQYQKKWQPVKKDNPAGGTACLEVNADGRTGVESTATVGQEGLQVDAADTVGS
ncbi:uncharacterized protein LOC125186728 isoform X2 [Salvia hispanica]|uniref:uncharacterized protein LOC125186728 isoform X2 n=1 Tax=Salvia hispanica TaxID=49212 RepID=UPI002009938E|nr:uncharacterized protein LOC125186728 isoform X2 [Salvia hispanica]